jgi:hypothetical protein
VATLLALVCQSWFSPFIPQAKSENTFQSQLQLPPVSPPAIFHITSLSFWITKWHLNILCIWTKVTNFDEKILKASSLKHIILLFSLCVCSLPCAIKISFPQLTSSQGNRPGVMARMEWNAEFCLLNKV